jgi:hypothetical protein
MQDVGPSVLIFSPSIVVVSILRMVLMHQIDLNDPDLTWNYTKITAWTGVEQNIACFCACMPTFRPLITYAMTGSFDSSAPSTWVSSSSSGSASDPRTKRTKLSDLSNNIQLRNATQQTQPGHGDTMVEGSHTELLEGKEILVTKRWDIEHRGGKEEGESIIHINKL